MEENFVKQRWGEEEMASECLGRKKWCDSQNTNGSSLVWKDEMTCPLEHRGGYSKPHIL